MTFIPVSMLRTATSNLFYCLTILSLLLVISPSSHAEADAEAVRIFSLINERLSYMEEVALYKYQNHIPVEDLEREKFVLDKSLLSATEQGLDSDSISGFFQSQMDAAKAIQYRYRADWLAVPAPKAEAIDLKKDIRPKLVSLGKEIILSISHYLKQFHSFNPNQQAAFMSTLKVHKLSAADKKNIFDSLLAVKLQ